MRSARSGADDRYIGRRRKERGEGGLRVCRVHRTSMRGLGGLYADDFHHVIGRA